MPLAIDEPLPVESQGAGDVLAGGVLGERGVTEGELKFKRGGRRRDVVAGGEVEGEGEGGGGIGEEAEGAVVGGGGGIVPEADEVEEGAEE